MAQHSTVLPRRGPSPGLSTPLQRPAADPAFPWDLRAHPAIAGGLRCAVLVPCHNEAAAIVDVVADFRRTMPFAEIHVYDNNSTDGTAALAAASGARVARESRQGKGHVVRRMFADVDADYYILVDGDGTYAAADSLSLLAAAIAGRCDLVNGRRVQEGPDAYRPGHAAGNRALTGLVRRMFGRGLDDMLSGSKVFSRGFVKSFPGRSHGFEIETELTVHALSLDLAVAEHPIRYGARREGSASKLNTVRDGVRILATIVRLLRHERPLLFFSALAALGVATCAGLGVPVIATYLSTGLVPRLPTAILALGAGLFAAGAFFTGLILDTVTVGRREAKRLHHLMVARPCRDVPA